MPFTFSHPAFVWPMAKIKPKYFSYTGLFFGSIAPDCHMYLTFSTYPIIENNIYGIFSLYMPLAIIMSVIYHKVVRNVLISHLPAPFDTRYSGILLFDFVGYLKKKYGVFLCSVFIAIVVHLALDNVTHEYTTFTKIYPDSLSSTISFTSSLSFKIYYFLQIILSLYGLGYMVLYVLTYSSPAGGYKTIPKQDKLLYYYLLFVTFTAVLIGRFFLPWQKEFFNDLVMISIMSAAMLTVLLASTAIFIKNRFFK